MVKINNLCLLLYNQLMGALPLYPYRFSAY